MHAGEAEEDCQNAGSGGWSRKDIHCFNTLALTSACARWGYTHACVVWYVNHIHVLLVWLYPRPIATCSWHRCSCIGWGATSSSKWYWFTDFVSMGAVLTHACMHNACGAHWQFHACIHVYGSILKLSAYRVVAANLMQLSTNMCWLQSRRKLERQQRQWKIWK